MGFVDILLSGIVGALVATLLLIWHQDLSEKIKERKDLIDKVSDWLDTIYTRLQLLSSEKELIYAKEQTPSMTQEEYNLTNNELRVHLLSSKILLKASYIYGDGVILDEIKMLHENLLKAARTFWKATRETWSDENIKILKLFEEKIEPARTRLTQLFLNSIKEMTAFHIAKKYVADLIKIIYKPNVTHNQS